MIRLYAAIVLLSLAATAEAAAYRVDLVVFQDLENLPGEAGSVPRAPELTRTYELSDSSALASSGIRILPETDFGLSEVWNRLRNSRRFRPLIRLAWVQNDPPSERGPRLHIHDGPAITVGDSFSAGGAQASYRLDGTVSLLLSRYLHLDVDLAWTDSEYGEARSYRLDERRRMRSGELHHLDSPKFGIVARVTRADGG